LEKSDVEKREENLDLIKKSLENENIGLLRKIEILNTDFDVLQDKQNRLEDGSTKKIKE
jgi:hypothetical protein